MKTKTLSLLLGLLIAQTDAQDIQLASADDIDDGIPLPILQSDSTLPTNSLNTVVTDEPPLLDNSTLFDTPTTVTIENLDDAINATVNTSTTKDFPTTHHPSEIARLLNDNGQLLMWQGINNHLHSFVEVQQLYAQVNFQPLWTINGQITPMASSVIQTVKDAWQHALRPESYHSEAISSLKQWQFVAEPAKFDIVLTDAFITLKKHLANGIVNPKQQFSTWNDDPEPLDFLNLYEQATKRGNAYRVLSVNNADYRQLQAAYIEAVKNSHTDTPQKADIHASSLRVGQKGDAVIALRKRLGLATDRNIYDNTVRQAVKAYQSAHGLGADGIAGRRTIAHLNGKSHPEQNITKLAINMERLRWQGDIPIGNYIWVNIPAYKMAIRNGSDFVFESNVIVGRPQRQTPVFHDTLEHVVLAPYWNVPKTIYNEDKLPKLIKNPHALGNNMQVLDKATGQVVNPTSVDWRTASANYRLRELPGPRNSLGHMKFLFPNRHAIYLHDTPTRRLFKKHRRAFSSGCVRVERAEDLAIFLLNDQGYNRKRIKKESRQKREKWVNVSQSKRYPVFLNYYTAWVDKSGHVRYSNDIYGHDRTLRQLYQSALKQH